MNYAGRAAGLKKVVNAEEAKLKCPSIVLQHVPTWREGDTTWRYRDDALEHMDIDKSSLDYYRLQSKKAMAVLKQTLPGDRQLIEKAGIDETYVDLCGPVHQELLNRFPELRTEPSSLDTHLPLPIDPLLDWRDTAVEEDTSDGARQHVDWDDIALHIGCEIVKSIRSAVQAELHYTCSAGIARNKVVAKLAAGHNKPNRQTVVRTCGIESFLHQYKFTKIRGLGAKLGREVSKAFNTELVADLLKVPRATLASKISSSSATWVYNVIRGIEYSEVTDRTQLKSVLSAKTFMVSLRDISQAEKWLYIFAADIMGRLDDLGGDRRPKTVAVHLQVNGPRAPTRSKQGPIPLGATLNTDLLLKLSRDLLLALEKEGSPWPLVTLSVSVNDLVDVERGSRAVDSLFAAAGKTSPLPSSRNSNGWSSNAKVVDIKVVEAVKDTRAIPKKRTLFDLGFAQQGPGNEHISKKVRAVDNLRAKDDAKGDINGPGSRLHEDAPDAEDSEGAYDCPTCGRPVPASNVLEHLDWHTAMELSENG
jgi:DNA polymerase eta